MRVLEYCFSPSVHGVCVCLFLCVSVSVCACVCVCVCVCISVCDINRHVRSVFERTPPLPPPSPPPLSSWSSASSAGAEGARPAMGSSPTLKSDSMTLRSSDDNGCSSPTIDATGTCMNRLKEEGRMYKPVLVMPPLCSVCKGVYGVYMGCIWGVYGVFRGCLEVYIHAYQGVRGCLEGI